ncbi:hypothetical protein [Frankia sp. AiPa1]|uniref:hypothetical protein n=1 Tax=Frankia sp. AiPa1 TaxID=573492 RepID=UPI00202B60EB|nr:hypothetical protein [Frankia sp. AiPa1]MCL9758889.1 hypothetical protein [Frankia sp. AiPa1]
MRLLLDGQQFDLPAGTDPVALRRRAGEVMSGEHGNTGLDRILLASGDVLEVNWRAIGVVEVIDVDPDDDVD